MKRKKKKEKNIEEDPQHLNWVSRISLNHTNNGLFTYFNT